MDGEINSMIKIKFKQTLSTNQALQKAPKGKLQHGTANHAQGNTINNSRPSNQKAEETKQTATTAKTIPSQQNN